MSTRLARVPFSLLVLTCVVLSTVALAAAASSPTAADLRALEPAPGTLSGSSGQIRMTSPDDVHWSDAFGPSGLGMNGTVWGLFEHGDKLYAGGEFTTAGGVPAVRVAAFDGTAWSALGSGVSGRAFSFATYRGDLIVGGEFYSAGGALGTTFIARWDGQAWHPLANGVSGPVRALLVDGDNLIVGGDFDHCGATVAHKVAVWDGTEWKAMGDGFGGGYADLGVRGLEMLRNTIYAAGHFTYSGQRPTAYIARWTGEHWLEVDGGLPAAGYSFFVRGQRLIAGSTVWRNGEGRWEDLLRRWPPWQPLGTGELRDPFPNAGRAFATRGGRLIAGGQFPSAADVPVNYVAKWDGQVWEPLGSGLNAPVYALANYMGSLFAGGEFSAAGNKPSACIARWDGPVDVDVVVQSLNAARVRQDVILSWKLSEEMLDRLAVVHVERADAGGPYEELPPGATPPDVWRFVDATNPGTTASYRLRLSLIHGADVYSPTVGANPLTNRGDPELFVQPRVEDASVHFGFHVVTADTRARIRVFNARGQLVRAVTDAVYEPGDHTIAWDRRTTAGALAGRGVYFAAYDAAGQVATYKIVLAH